MTEAAASPQIRAVVFDLWGTLMSERRDTFPVRARLRFERCAPILAKYGIETTQEEFTKHHQRSNSTLARLQEYGRDVSGEDRARHVFYQYEPGIADHIDEADATAFAEAYGGVIEHTPPDLLSGAREVLEECRARGLRTGLISNTGVAGGRHLRRVFERHRVIDYFDALMFSDEQRRAKPHPGLFQAALDTLGVTAAETVFVGDTPRYDVEPPRRYGWWVVQIGERADGDPPAHIRLPHVGELFEGLGRLALRTPGQTE
ncbi:MAG: HAD family hydrolase [Dehalococcoidia bacterium]|nr:MAG: HAD family hydrolase [Dehalococcoidia bacterium]